MMLLLTFAFGAGLVSPLNPCGFGLLPAFLGYQLGSDDQRRDTPLAARLWRGLGSGAAVSTGFTGVLVSAALLIALGLRSLLQFVPFAAVVIGVVLVGAGVAVLAGRRVPLGALGRLGGLGGGAGNGVGTESRRLVVFGAGYAVASVACTVGILLAVVGQALATGSFPGMLAVLAAYGAGAATLLTALTVSTAVAGSVLSRRLRAVLPVMEPLAGILLILSGTYLVATNVGGVRDTPAVRAVNDWFSAGSAYATGVVQSISGWFALVLLALVLLAALLLLPRRRIGSKTTGRLTSRSGDGLDPDAEPRPSDCCSPAKTQVHDAAGGDPPRTPGPR